jgi:hypothetical protein
VKQDNGRDARTRGCRSGPRRTASSSRGGPSADGEEPTSGFSRGRTVDAFLPHLSYSTLDQDNEGVKSVTAQGIRATDCFA